MLETSVGHLTGYPKTYFGKLSDEIQGSNSQYSLCLFSRLLVFFLKKFDYLCTPPPLLLGTFFQFSHLSVNNTSVLTNKSLLTVEIWTRLTMTRPSCIG
jgi:hypothetical protein